MSTPLFRQAVPADVDRCYEIETLAYEGDEAATPGKDRHSYPALSAGIHVHGTQR